MEKKNCSERTRQTIFQLLLRGYHNDEERAKKDYERLHLEIKTPTEGNTIRKKLIQEINRRENIKLRKIAKSKGLCLALHSDITYANICQKAKNKQIGWLTKTLQLAKKVHYTLDYCEEDLTHLDVGDAQVLIDKWQDWRGDMEYNLKYNKISERKSIDWQKRFQEVILTINNKDIELKNGLTAYKTAQYILQTASNIKVELAIQQVVCYLRNSNANAEQSIIRLIIKILRELYGSGQDFILHKNQYDVYNLTNLEAIYYLYALSEERARRLEIKRQDKEERKRKWMADILQTYGSWEKYYESLGWERQKNSNFFIKPKAVRDESLPDFMQPFKVNQYQNGKRQGTRGKLVFE